jgi:transcriptional regulator with XRE-family HTH domain
MRTAESRDPLLLHVAERVAAVRQQLGLTQDQLAEKAGCAPLTVSHIESGRRNPTLKSLSRVATALGLDIRDLFPKGDNQSDGALVADIAVAVSVELEAIGTALDRIRSVVSSDPNQDALKRHVSR